MACWKKKVYCKKYLCEFSLLSVGVKSFVFVVSNQLGLWFLKIFSVEKKLVTSSIIHPREINMFYLLIWQKDNNHPSTVALLHICHVVMLLCYSKEADWFMCSVHDTILLFISHGVCLKFIIRHLVYNNVDKWRHENLSASMTLIL